MAKERVSPALPVRVIGIGASAGGLEALRELVAHLPLDTGYAFVVLQHLPPSQAGALAKLLADVTTLPVVDIEAGHRVEPNTINVVPPHTIALVQRGAFVLRVAKERGRPHNPIDELFVSLAEALRARAVGIVLSGTGDDGTEGLRSIHQVGGLTCAQEPSTAQFDQMPRSAIASGCVELIMAPGELAEELGMVAALGTLPAGETDGEPPAIERVLGQLREASGIDFTSYKRTTIERRLARRLAQHQLPSLAAYSEYLAQHPDEARTVYEDLLIHVTEFFRDRVGLETLIARALPELLQAKPPDAPLRVWVPGCSTGEEVYSLAILLLESTDHQRRAIQLFGSDLSERALEVARRGFYPAAVTSRIGAERLERFFVREEAGYRIKSAVRERCVFVRHDLVTDPPFSKLDLVSCRNTLIYLGLPLQKRVMSIFHYALQQPGFLLLGKAESIAGFETLFATVDAEARLYARKPGARAVLSFSSAGQLVRPPWQRDVDVVRSTMDVQRDVDHVLLARYSPACVVVNAQLEVIQFRGRTSPYLEQPPGEPQVNVLRLARAAIAGELSMALESVQRTEKTVRRENLRITDHSVERTVNLEVVPLRPMNDAKRHFLIVFEEPQPPVVVVAKSDTQPASRDSTEVTVLRQELEATKEHLHSIASQHLATGEELGLANEELQSANEELQSTNEELQTAKEELQSSNEELETVNEELGRNNKRLQETNDDLVNVLASIDLAIIIVDNERKVRRFTPKARAVMKLIPTDIGRPIADLMPSVAVPELDDIIARVIDTLELREAEVCHPDGTWYRMQIRPYRTVDHKINGATISFVDITAMRRARENAAAIVETVPTPLVVVDAQLRVQTVNHAFVTTFGPVSEGDELVAHARWSSPVLVKRLRDVVATGAVFDDLQVEDIAGERVLRVGARPMPVLDSKRLVLIGIADVTERRRLEQAREAAERERGAFLDVISHELRTPLSAILLWAEALRNLDANDPRRERAIAMILDSANSEAQLIDDLLDLALAHSTGLAVMFEQVEAGPVVQAAIDQVRADAERKHVVIETSIDDDGRVSADPRRLGQIARGLISNAVKFTPDGGKVGIAMSTTKGNWELRVQNTGPGIPPDFIHRVFDPFSRADDSSARALGGLGIGLSLVRHFVERHGGTIDVVSPGADRGTTFTVRIPARV